MKNLITYDEFLNEGKNTNDDVKSVVELSNKYEHLYYYDSLDFQDKFVIYLDEKFGDSTRTKFEYIYLYEYNRSPDELGWHIQHHKYLPSGRFSNKRVKFKSSKPTTDDVIKHIKRYIKQGVKA